MKSLKVDNISNISPSNSFLLSLKLNKYNDRHDIVNVNQQNILILLILNLDQYDQPLRIVKNHLLV